MICVFGVFFFLFFNICVCHLLFFTNDVDCLLPSSEYGWEYRLRSSLGIPKYDPQKCPFPCWDPGPRSNRWFLKLAWIRIQKPPRSVQPSCRTYVYWRLVFWLFNDFFTITTTITKTVTTTLCLCPPSSKIGSSPLKGCRGNCRPGGK